MRFRERSCNWTRALKPASDPNSVAGVDWKIFFRVFDGFDAIAHYYCSINARDLNVLLVGEGREIPGHLNGAREGDRTAV